MENYVKFLRGTPAAFEKLSAKDNNTLYFISEPGAKNGLLYLGEKLIAGGSTGDITNLSIADLADIIIDESGLVDGSVLMYDYLQKKWVNKTLDEVIVDVMAGATSEQAGSAGLVPAPRAGEQNKFLRGDGTWADAGLTAEQANELTAATDAIEALVGDSKNVDGRIPSVTEIATEVLTEALIPEGAKESLDTLQEIASWIQSHPDDASHLNSEVGDLKTLTSNLNTAINGEKGLVSRVGALEDILNDTTNEEGEVVPGLVSVVNKLVTEQVTGDFVLNTTYKTEVGDIKNLVFSDSKNSSIIDEINSINHRLTWVDMNE